MTALPIDVGFLIADRLITCTDRMVIDDGCLEVVDGLIVAVGRRADFGTRLESRPIAAFPGCSVLPGLVDAHCHVTLAGDGRSLGEMAQDTDESFVDTAVRNLDRHLRAGVTTLRDLGARGSTIFEVREALSRGVISGPRMVVAGRPITPTGGHVWWMNGEADGVDALRTLTHELVAAGADVIKTMASGGATAGTNPGYPSLSEAELRAVVSAAHDLGVPVAAHCHATESMRRALAAGVDSLEHASFLAEPSSPADGQQGASTVRLTVGAFDVACDVIDALRSSRTYLGMTLLGAKAESIATIDAIRSIGHDVPVELAADARKVDLVRLIVSNGLAGQLVICTDAGPVDKTFGNLGEPIEFAVAAGLPSDVAVKSLTSIAAGSCGVANLVGSLEPGKVADLLVVGGDPLASITSLRDVRAVYQAGSQVL